MASRDYDLHDGKAGAALAVRLTFKASHNALVGILRDGTIRVHVTAPPKNGQDNKALIRLLSRVLNVPESNVDIVAGETGRDKLVSVMGLSAKALSKLIRSHLGLEVG